MTTGETDNSNPYKRQEEILENAQRYLQDAVGVVLPESPDANPLGVFPGHGEVRAHDRGMELDEAQTADLLVVAAEHGFGRKEDRTLSQEGLINADVIIQGGQPHKVLAELQLVLEDEAAKPSRIFVAGSPRRKITSAAEKHSAERLIGHVPETEYDAVRALTASLPDFRAEEYELPFGYDIHNDFATTNNADGQFMMLGWIKNTPIIQMRIDREDYLEAGEPRYRNQPGTAEVVRIVDAVQRQEDETVHPIAFVTSATYEASSIVNGARASLTVDRPIGVVSYGSDRLEAVKGEPAPVAINQLPGELHEIAVCANKLDAALTEAR